MSAKTRPALLALGILLHVLGSGPVAATETVRLIPDDRAPWRPSSLFAWIRPMHNYGDRVLEVTTTPPGATLDLFYVRRNFQKRYEQVDAPAKVMLPSRVSAGSRDAVNIRAFLEGYRQKEVSIRVSSSQSDVHIELVSLPNTLQGVSHAYLAGRGALVFLTRESLQVRIQDVESGFRVILSETAKGPGVEETLNALRSPLIEEVESLQLGEDLMVRVKVPEAARGLQLRYRQARDEARDLHLYAIDMLPADGGVEVVTRARSAFAAIGAGDVAGCAVRFDATLREELEPAALSRALSPSGSFTDRYLREAMKRLGTVSRGGRVQMLDGSSYDPRSPIELEAALAQPAEAEGLLALLRTFVGEMEAPPDQRTTLRGLVAPEMSPVAFDTAVDQAESAERTCLASR